MEEELDKIKELITTGLAIVDLECDYCHGPVLGKPRVLKFTDLKRFFVAILVKVITVKNMREE